ncbi:hypothetical protein HDU91_005226 [Kappamyces sp. JEL0680]|nr:hypothetical protein HDU91_005226 [Kappamyces sp. JEL0680]
MILLFLACLTTAFGPSAVVLALFVGKNSRLVLLAMASVVQLYAQAAPFTLAVYGSLVQEAARVGLYYCIGLIRPMMQQITPNASGLTDFQHNFACGFGWALMSALVQYIQPLVQSSGYGQTYNR